MRDFLAKKKKKIETKNRPLFLNLKTERMVFGIIFLTLTLIITLGFFNLAGSLGRFLNNFFEFVFGWGKYVLPLVLLILSYVSFRAESEDIYFSLGLGSLLFIFGSLGLIEIISEEIRPAGYFGLVLSYPFLKLVGFLVSCLIFSVIIAISLILFFGPLVKERREKIPDFKEKNEKAKNREVVPFSPIFEEKSSRLEKLMERIIKKTPEFEVKEIAGIAETTAQKKEEIEVLENQFRAFQYKIPPVELLEEDRGQPTTSDIKASSNIIKRTLQNFGIEVEMGEVNIGPTVTQFTLKPAEGVKLSRITILGNDLSLALAAHPIRIEAPIPGKSLVGIEVPNKVVKLVRLRHLIDSPDFWNSPSNLTFVLGRNVMGDRIYADLRKMPHLLLAGSTGSGKTIALNTIIMSLLYRNSPATLRLVLIDPKRVEFPIYNGIPHLLIPVIVDAQRTINALRWLIGEMERRFEILAQAQARDIMGYNLQFTAHHFSGEGFTNKQFHKDEEKPLSYIVVIVDELADLMAARGKEVEAGIVRLAQMARAVGIHLVLATQRPSVEVITGLIKANITSRISFQVASHFDSRTILDMAGAEKLLGRGDLLFLSAESAKPRRIQGAYISDKEVKRIADFIKKQRFEVDRELEERLGKMDRLPAEPSDERAENDRESSGFWGEGRSDEELYEQAREEVIRAKKASASFLQRRLRIGYARAARIIDMLEDRGVVGPGEGAKPREVYFEENDQ
ncbi:MAG: cell division protein FtsK [Parcubacteria group bacterium CG11_big_fil_rev_8_21_14_0_20_39_14]|nr:MAG: cell division protein FtsK [Parcubacteria group bacterium CG11_big_fil_rev_8_21_14_0_20_39_14]PIS35679.1 MAG: cell division protein FtsK [Parcubacteria group bacterium CG08_land_8_20_14_0_20_38_56]